MLTSISILGLIYGQSWKNTACFILLVSLIIMWGISRWPLFLFSSVINRSARICDGEKVIRMLSYWYLFRVKWESLKGTGREKKWITEHHLLDLEKTGVPDNPGLFSTSLVAIKQFNLWILDLILCCGICLFLLFLYFHLCPSTYAVSEAALAPLSDPANAGQLKERISYRYIRFGRWAIRIELMDKTAQTVSSERTKKENWSQ